MIRPALLALAFLLTACKSSHEVGRYNGECSTFLQDCPFGTCIDDIPDGCDGTSFAMDCPGTCIFPTDIAITPLPDGFF